MESNLFSELLYVWIVVQFRNTFLCHVFYKLLIYMGVPWLFVCMVMSLLGDVIAKYVIILDYW